MTQVACLPEDRPAARIRVAMVRRAHGLNGELRVEPLGGGADRFQPGLQLTAERGSQRFTVVAARPVVGGDLLLSLREVADRDAAERLRGGYLYVDTAAARQLGNQEWFVHDLVGLRAVTAAGAAFGRVVAVEPYVGNDVLVIGTATGEVRLPMVHAFVTGVDLGAGTITVTPWDEDR